MLLGVVSDLLRVGDPVTGNDRVDKTNSPDVGALRDGGSFVDSLSGLSNTGSNAAL
jgi:hypothetical protein